MFGLIKGPNLDLDERHQIKNNPIKSFSYSRGGDMNGSSHTIYIVKINEDEAIMSFSDSDWYSQDPKVKEYIVTIDVLKEIEEIFRKHKMYNWNNKKFTDIFVCDGASSGYSFTFEGDGYANVSFSSQIYPDSYWGKLQEIHEVINKYTGQGKLLPGFVLPEVSEEEKYNYHQPVKGEVTLEVYEYNRNYLYFRLMNGTENEISYKRSYELFVCGEEKPFYSYDTTYINKTPSNYVERESIGLEERLQPGKYILKIDMYQCEFEIK